MGKIMKPRHAHGPEEPYVANHAGAHPDELLRAIRRKQDKGGEQTDGKLGQPLQRRGKTSLNSSKGGEKVGD
jgi:hypothetical protein